jgi:hypothetical protein
MKTNIIFSSWFRDIIEPSFAPKRQRSYEHDMFKRLESFVVHFFQDPSTSIVVKRHTGIALPNCLETTTRFHNVESARAHLLHIGHTRKIESDNDYQITEDKNRTLEIITLSLAVHIAEKENTKNDGDHVPLWKDETECIVRDIRAYEVLSGDSTEQYECWNLK